MKRFIAVLLTLIIVISMAPTTFAASETDAESTFAMVVLNVGEGNAVFVSCDGYTMLVDGGNSSKSDMIYSFLDYYGIDRLDYMVASHADADHVGGLSGALHRCTVGVAMCTVTENDTESFNNYVKFLADQNNKIIVPDAGDSFSLGSAKVTVLAPHRGELLSDNTSIVLRIEYGKTSFLLMGDAAAEDEEQLLLDVDDIESTVILVGHHGSSTSTTEQLINSVKPEYSIISVGEDNKYGHPAESVLEILEASGSKIYRTDMHGTIVISSDKKTVTVNAEYDCEEDPTAWAGGYKRASIQDDWDTVDELNPGLIVVDGSEKEEETTEPVVQQYVGNVNSKVFHLPGCMFEKKMKEKNKYYYEGDREGIIAEGYTPCKHCNP